MQIVVLDAYSSDQGQLEAWSELTHLGELTIHPRCTADEAQSRVAEAEAIFTNKVVVDKALLAVAPKLRYIGVLATGTNAVDLDACRERGIAVCNVPGYSSDSVAQLCMAYLLHHACRVHDYDHAVSSGAWERSPDFSFTLGPIADLAGMRLAIVGYGAIGQAFAQRARAFDMIVDAAQVPGRPTHPERRPLNETLAEADVVSLHCPLSPETEAMVDEAFLAQCKPGSMLINTGRGPLIDEAALIAALDSGQIAAAYLDVLSQEPPPHGHALCHHPRCHVTPHIAWASVDSRARLIREVTANFQAFLKGERRNRVD